MTPREHIAAGTLSVCAGASIVALAHGDVLVAAGIAGLSWAGIAAAAAWRWLNSPNPADVARSASELRARARQTAPSPEAFDWMMTQSGAGELRTLTAGDDPERRG